MRWKKRRGHIITKGFAIFPRYIHRIKRWVWLEKIFIYGIDTVHGSAYWYDINYRELYYGCARPFSKFSKEE